MSLVNIKDLDYSYLSSSSNALKDINLTMNEGIVGIIGKKDSGKSTLMKLIQGVNKNYKGTLLIQEEIPTYLTKSIISNYENLQSLRNNVIEMKRFYKTMFDDFDSSYFDSFIAKFNILEKSKIPFLDKEQLSLLSLALCLSRRSLIYLLDEPFIELSDGSLIKIKEILKELKKSSLIIISSRNGDHIEDLIDRVVVLDNGSIVIDELKSVLINVNQTNFQNILKKYI